MKKETIKTKNKKSILQVYHNSFAYFKDMKSYEDRKEFTKWKSSVESSSPYLSQGQLVLPRTQNLVNLNFSDVVVLHDFNADTEEEGHQKQASLPRAIWQDQEMSSMLNASNPLQKVSFLNLNRGQSKLGIFQLIKVEGKIEVHLMYSLDHIGEPKRSQFKLCQLEENKPIEIKINGKLDHSGTRMAERKYIEHNYIFELLGQTNEFILKPTPFSGVVKKIPKPWKTIDLMKKLY